jgi:hypothetical protein
MSERLEKDYLDEDTPISKQNYIVFTFLSPEQVINYKKRAVKPFAVFDSRQDAIAYVEKLEETDKYTDIYVGEIGKWIIWAPDVNRRNFKNEQEYINVMLKKEKELNELARRIKDKIDKSDVEYNINKKNTINAGMQERYKSKIKRAKQTEEIVKKTEEYDKPDNDEVVSFETPDKTEIKSDDSTKNIVKKIKDVTKPLDGQESIIVSFMSPEGILNSNVYGVKFRGLFSNDEIAGKYCNDNIKDKYFDTYIGATGSWFEWDQDPSTIKDVHYNDKRLEKIMRKTHEKTAKSKTSNKDQDKNDIPLEDGEATKNIDTDKTTDTDKTEEKQVPVQKRKKGTTVRRNMHDGTSVKKRLQEKYKKLLESREQDREKVLGEVKDSTEEERQFKENLEKMKKLTEE